MLHIGEIRNISQSTSRSQRQLFLLETYSRASPPPRRIHQQKQRLQPARMRGQPLCEVVRDRIATLPHRSPRHHNQLPPPSTVGFIMINLLNNRPNFRLIIRFSPDRKTRNMADWCPRDCLVPLCFREAALSWKCSDGFLFARSMMPLLVAEVLQRSRGNRTIASRLRGISLPGPQQTSDTCASVKGPWRRSERR